MIWTAEQIEDCCRHEIPGYDAWANSDGYYFDHAAAVKAVNFFPERLCFTVARWAGQPFELQRWQVAIIGNIFGWKRVADGLRRYRKCLIFTARKSGKTEIAAGIALELLYCDGEPAPEIVTAAGNADQAERIFKAAKTMVDRQPVLKARAKVLTRSIQHIKNNGVLKVINAAAKTKHGDNLHGAMIDELHVHPDPELVDVLETSMKARSQPLVVYTTTAGDNLESIAGEVYDYACKVRDAIFPDPEFLPVIYEIPKDGDISNPENWKLAQPNLGVTVKVEDYKREYEKGLKVPRSMSVFRQLSCNQWVDGPRAWLGLEEWRGCAAKSVSIGSLKGHRATMGIDLSSVTDTTAVVVAVEDGDLIRLFPYVFIPKNNAEGRLARQKRDRAPYRLWIDQGHITATDGNAVDYEVVEGKVMELSALLDLQEVQADKYNASGLLERLIKKGVRVTTVPQGWSLSEAVKETERRVLTKKISHPDNPCFNWQIGNAATKTDERDNAWLDKRRSSSRIDAPVAGVMAVNAFCFGEGKEASVPKTYLRFESLV